MLGASGTFFQLVRLSAMILVDCIAAWLRFAYWMLSPKTGRWTWGQYCPMIPVTDLKPLLDQARAEGTVV